MVGHIRGGGVIFCFLGDKGSVNFHFHDFCHLAFLFFLCAKNIGFFVFSPPLEQNLGFRAFLGVFFVAS